MSKPRLLIVTTVPMTLRMILRDQPRFLGSGFDVHLATSAVGSCGDIEANELAPVHDVPMKRRIGPLHDLRSILRMVQLIRRLRPQIVHSYTPKAGLVAMSAAWLCRVPVRIHTFTGLVFPTQPGIRRDILRSVDALICRMATTVVPEGQGVRRDLVEASVTQKPLRVIGNGNVAGVDVRWFCRGAEGVRENATALRQSLGIPQGAFVLCFVGRLNLEKGINELLHAFPRLPDEPHLLLVGGEDDSAPLASPTRAVLRQQDRVHALGFVDDIRPALALSDVLVLPSYREGFPNVLLQAGAMELPVIASDVNGSNEIVQPGDNGWLVPPRDGVRLEQAIREAMGASREVRRAMGERARTLVEQRFERGAHWRRMLDFYRGELREAGL